jgi:hypothetical protein
MPKRCWLVLVLLLGCSTPSTSGSSTTSGDEPSPQTDEPFTRCKNDDDCRISCIQPNDCCGDTKGQRCDEARHWDDHAKIEATRGNCQNFDFSKCPATDHSVPDFVHLPVCKRGRCEAKQEKREPPPAPIDVSDYDRTCKTDADCIVVHTQPCAKCGCGDDPIAASEKQRFDEAIAAVKCPPYDPWPDIQCGDCRDALPWCDAGQCKAK